MTSFLLKRKRRAIAKRSRHGVLIPAFAGSSPASPVSRRCNMGGRGGSFGMAGSSSNPFPKSVVQETVYHGTNVSNITEFSTGGRESSGAIFFGKEEDYAEEEAYLKQERSGGEQTMYEAKLDIRNPLEVTLPPGQFADNVVERRYIQQAKAAGHDAVIFHSNTGDPYLDDTFYAVFSPKQVKITNRRKI